MRAKLHRETMVSIGEIRLFLASMVVVIHARETQYSTRILCALRWKFISSRQVFRHERLNIYGDSVRCTGKRSHLSSMIFAKFHGTGFHGTIFAKTRASKNISDVITRLVDENSRMHRSRDCDRASSSELKCHETST